MTNGQTIPIVLPLIYLVVLKIGDISREIDLGEFEKQDGWRITSPVHGFTSFASLGHFVYLHTINVVILQFAFISTAYLVEGDVLFVLINWEGPALHFILGMITFLLWLLLPLFEVDEYSTVDTNKNGVPKSFSRHVNSVFLTGIFILVMVYLLNHLTTKSISISVLTFAAMAIVTSCIFMLRKTPKYAVFWILFLLFYGVLRFVFRFGKADPQQEIVALGLLGAVFLMVLEMFIGIEQFLKTLSKEI